MVCRPWPHSLHLHSNIGCCPAVIYLSCFVRRFMGAHDAAAWWQLFLRPARVHIEVANQKRSPRWAFPHPLTQFSVL